MVSGHFWAHSLSRPFPKCFSDLFVLRPRRQHATHESRHHRRKFPMPLDDQPVRNLAWFVSVKHHRIAVLQPKLLPGEVLYGTQEAQFSASANCGSSRGREIVIRPSVKRSPLLLGSRLPGSSGKESRPTRAPPRNSAARSRPHCRQRHRSSLRSIRKLRRAGGDGSGLASNHDRSRRRFFVTLAQATFNRKSTWMAS
jgi:hypothetical protein